MQQSHPSNRPGGGSRTVVAAASLIGLLSVTGCGVPTPPSPAPSAPHRSPSTSPPASPDSPRTRPAPDVSSGPPKTVPGPARSGFRAVDGDTVERGALQVRVIGIDTPEVGECGYERAAAVTARFVSGGVTLSHRSGRDRYGRLLAYVSDSRGRDLGTLLIRRGLANARYDSTDGYEWHPHQARYLRLDRRTRHVCGAAADGLGGPEPYVVPDGQAYPSCDAAESAGAAPLRRGDPGYSTDLDGDGDGVACE